MRYVSNHLTKHHLLHAPHKWFLAFLISPIHALEVHYQKKYHLRFAHARKLFLFDMLLLASIFIIGGIGLFWHWYDPTVQKNVAISIKINGHEQSELNRVQSGEHLFFSVTYKNNSEVVLVDPIMHINFPVGFILFNVNGKNFVTNTHSISVPNIEPKTEGEIIFAGQFFGEPNHNYPTGIELVYRQKNRNIFEVVTTGVIATLRDSTLIGSLSAPATIFENSSWKSELVIKNNNHHDLENIVIPVESNKYTSYKIDSTTAGKIDREKWYIPHLNANESATTTLTITASVPKNIDTISLELTPSIIINGTIFNQNKIAAKSAVAHPNIEISGQWSVNTASPGDIAQIIIRLKNTGSVDLKNLNLSIPLPSALVSIAAARQKNNFSSQGSNLIISQKKFPELNFLARGTAIQIPIIIPISLHPSGATNLNLVLNPKITAEVVGITQLFETNAQLNPLAIGTSLNINASAHYYSAEGDQIGRGHLPPVVGKETKYWALLEIQNGTSAVSGLKLTATLPSGVNWTGKTSVNQGREPIYSPENRTVSWEISHLSAHESAQVNFELAIMPTPSERGTILPLLANVHISGWDTFINKTVIGFGSNIDTSLPDDAIARKKGVLVQ
ncbi:MAG: hypothetical protein A2983_03265 [Candidatus Magasanikbacteria bacterium RIFCSPLOWO2_01_FULL_40_15]|uniref:DUF11 domain-containing protein n=1 Tax=Candidatus Magasanikbacteria bacterium RIFCSPLOWO2_01_FULL_40_15 TaxID=1798686 RepID=A0A1F6N491_9BACT|nr:MAG: hypothetical protein A3C66_00880 [Candidatus Magasanikbacteria bacterium RIFCSPHIGHO2_02_FULL_41_35]OGH78510.1 MAG: hypothetical protein A2983_03265 [Candidatus Magasanikbacteria bacterium RIFCSPLOWO2_01_FULL_40_15]